MKDFSIRLYKRAESIIEVCKSAYFSATQTTGCTGRRYSVP